MVPIVAKCTVPILGVGRVPTFGVCTVPIVGVHTFPIGSLRTLNDHGQQVLQGPNGVLSASTNAMVQCVRGTNVTCDYCFGLLLNIGKFAA